MDTSMKYFPKSGQTWETVDAAAAGFDPARLSAAVAFAATQWTIPCA
jgi:hypothetical protein